MIRETDHVAAAQARLVAQYVDKASMANVVALMAAGLQEVEDNAFTLWSESVYNAAGAQLDTLGAVVGQAREGRDDATYRLWICTRVKINASNGTPEEILGVFRVLTGGTVPLELTEQYPAAFTLRMGSSYALDPVAAFAILNACKPAGVGATFIGATSSDATSFAFDPNGAGFGDSTDASVGGTLATVL